MRWRWLAIALVAAGCPAPARYTIERPGLACDRATRVARRTMLELGYTITDLVVPAGDRPGTIVGTKTRPDGTKSTGRVRIACDARGAVVQPVEDALIPDFDFSRGFDYSFKALVQMPDVDEPQAARGLEVLVHALDRSEALVDLGGVPVGADAVVVRVTVRNNTHRAVAVDPSRLLLVPAGGTSVGPLTGPALAAAVLPGAAGDRIRAERLTARRIPPHTTATGWLVYPAGAYREAQVSIEDVETEESEGFVAPVE